MRSNRLFSGWLLLALLNAAMYPTLIIISYIGAFVLPKQIMLAESRGAKEPPFILQLLMNLSDFTLHRFYIIFAVFLLSILITSAFAYQSWVRRGRSGDG